MWDKDSNRCLEKVQAKLEKVVTRLIHERFERYESLKTRLKHLVFDLLRSKHSDAWKQIQFTLKCESTPYTQNGHYLQAKKDEYLARYKDARAGKVAYIEEPQLNKRTTVSEVQGKGSDTSASSSQQATQTFNFSKDVKPLPHTLFPSSSSSSSQPSQSIFPAPANGATGSPFRFNNTQALAAQAFASPPSPAPTPAVERAHTEMDREERIKTENETLAMLAKLGYTGMKVEDLAKLNPSDEYETEMEVMAEVRAYFHVAYKRLIDIVPLTIDHAFLLAVSTALQQHLITQLGISSSARCVGYLAEDPHVVAEREELLGRKKRLESVRTELFNFGL